MVLVFLLLCIGSYERNIARGQSLEAGQESIKIEERRSVNLTWRIKKEPTAKHSIYLTEEIGPKKKVLYIGPSTETPYLKKRFGKRLVMDGESENVTVELKNSTYNDTCTLSLVVLFKDTNDETETIIYSATRIQICGPKGSPCVEAAQEGAPAGLIAGATVGSLLFIVTLILIVVLVKRGYKLKHSRMSRRLSSVLKREKPEPKEPPPTQLYEGDGEYTAIGSIQYEDLQQPQQEYDYAYSPPPVQEQENYLAPIECLQEESEHNDLLDNGESIYENTKQIHQSREKEKSKPKKNKNKPPATKKPNVTAQIGFRKAKAV